MAESQDPRWMVVANVVKQRIQGEDHQVTGGTRHFRGGAKVYVAADYPGMTETVVVIGRDRSGRFRTVAMNVWLLTNFRANVVYSPAILRRHAQAGEGSAIAVEASEAGVHETIAKYRLWIEHERKHREENGSPWWVVES